MTHSGDTKPVTKTWLMTGATSGIGRHVAQQLLEQGHRLIALVRSGHKIADLAAQYPDTLHIYILDLSQTDRIADIVRSVFETHGKIDVVFSAAGYALVGAAEELSEDAVSKHIATNLIAPIFLAKAALPFLRERKSGHIIHISSEGGQITYPSASIYHASKWGAEGFFEALAKELQALNIAVTLVEPGRIRTEFDENAEVVETAIEDYRKTAVGTYFRLLAMGRFPMIGDPAKVAEAIIRLSQEVKPPLRMVLGSDSYKNIVRETEKRLSIVKLQSKCCNITDI